VDSPLTSTLSLLASCPVRVIVRDLRFGRLNEVFILLKNYSKIFKIQVKDNWHKTTKSGKITLTVRVLLYNPLIVHNFFNKKCWQEIQTSK